MDEKSNQKSNKSPINIFIFSFEDLVSEESTKNPKNNSYKIFLKNPINSIFSLKFLEFPMESPPQYTREKAESDL